MANPKGNPQNLQPAPSDREVKLTDGLSFRVTKEMKQEVKSQDDPAEFCRQAIQDALDKKKQK
jgi:hypothetical protein